MQDAGRNMGPKAPYSFPCTAVGLLTLRAMSRARSLHNPCIQRFSGCALAMADYDEADGVSPCFESDMALFHA